MVTQPKADNTTNRLTAVLFITYLIVLYWILLFKFGVRFSYMRERRASLIPFHEPSVFNSENLLNVVIFVPLGIYAAILFQRWIFGKKLLFIFSLTLLVEGLQYILRVGAFDVTDIITNAFGGLIGLMLFKMTEKAFSNRVKAQKFTNSVALAGTVLMLVLLVLLKMNMLPIKYQ